MQRWIGGAAPVWPDRSWQVYALPPVDCCPELAELVRAYRAGVAAFAELSPVDDADAHMTVQPLPGWYADYDGERLNTVLEAVRAAVAELDPIEVILGPALCGSAGALLDCDATDDGPLAELFQRVRVAVGAATDTESPRSGWPGHVSLGYATASRDSGEVQSRLRRIRPDRVSWHLETLYLCDVAQDPVNHTYRWRTALPIHLGARVRHETTGLGR